MRMRTLGVLAVVTLIALVGFRTVAGDDKDEAVKTDMKALAGTWETLSFVNNGKKLGDEEAKTHTVTYDGSVAHFQTDDGKKTRETTRDLPKPATRAPDPGWYDDESLLWLARGLTLKAGYRAGYAHVINAGQPRVLTVEVTVDPPETVKVPAGEFSAWKVRYQREDSIYFVWVDTQSPNRMVKARIEDVTYELTGID